MTPEELQAARDVEGCYEYDHCKARELIDPLLEHIDEQAATIESLQADLEKFYKITDGRQISGVYNSETDRRVEVIRRYMVESIGCDQKLQRQQAEIDRLKAALIEERAINIHFDRYTSSFAPTWKSYGDAEYDNYRPEIRQEAMKELSDEFPSIFSEAENGDS